ncbi:unnamed protein product [Parajaminaea phylloscopi]
MTTTVEADGDLQTSSPPLNVSSLGRVTDISCLICLSSTDAVRDRAVLPLCNHSLFCFPCIVQWAELKRTCPLCVRDIGPYILHNIRSERDYERYYLRPSYGGPSQDATDIDAQAATRSIQAERLHRQHRQLVGSSAQSRRRPPIVPRAGEAQGWTERSREELASNDLLETVNDPLEQLDRALERRRIVYRERLFALHMGSNRHSGFQSAPSVASMSRKSHLAEQILPFLRRELMAMPLGPSVDVHFLTTYIVSVLRSLDVRGDAASRLLGELFGDHELAEHFCHELMTYMRSRSKSCAEFDRRVQYRWPWTRHSPLQLWSTSTSTRSDADGDQGQYHTSAGASRASDFTGRDRNIDTVSSDNSNSATRADAAPADSAEELDVAPTREEIIDRRARLLDRLASAKRQFSQRGREAQELPCVPNDDLPSTSGTSGSSIVRTDRLDDREALLRELILQRRQAHLSAGAESDPSATDPRRRTVSDEDVCATVDLSDAGSNTLPPRSLAQQQRELELRARARACRAVGRHGTPQ